VLVRHAEKTSSAPDAELSPEGIARAQRIATMLARSDATRLVATDVKRTQQTLAPLAQQLGRAIEVRPARDVDGLVEELRGSPDGAVVVVAHHSNGLPHIVRGLGATMPGLAPEAAAIDDSDYGRVLVLSLGCDRSRASVVQLSSDQ
jgi:broad specificity phosphatase PhoE